MPSGEFPTMAKLAGSPFSSRVGESDRRTTSIFCSAIRKPGRSNRNRRQAAKGSRVSVAPRLNVRVVTPLQDSIYAMKLANKLEKIEGVPGAHKPASFETFTGNSLLGPHPFEYETFASGSSPPETSTNAPVGLVQSASANTIHLLPGSNSTSGQDLRKPAGLCATVPPAVPGRKGHKSMSFRPGQSGAVQRKGKRWIGRFYKDVPGSSERKRTSVTLGSVAAMTKSEARRKLRSMLEEMGLNDDKHLERVINTRTFRQEAEWWRDNKLSLYKPSVQETMGSHLDKYLIPRLGDVPLEQLTERRVQELVAELRRIEYVVPNRRRTRRQLSPKSV